MRESGDNVVAPPDASRLTPDGSGVPLLDVRAITKRFGGLAAVAGVDLTIRKGEILGVIGPNGAGKTTFVNCITGLDKPTSGTILFRGEDITKTPSYAIGRLGIARTFQVVKPLKQLSVRDNVAIGAMFGARGKERTAKQARERAEEVLTRVGLQHRIGHTAADLSRCDGCPARQIHAAGDTANDSRGGHRRGSSGSLRY